MSDRFSGRSARPLRERVVALLFVVAAAVAWTGTVSAQSDDEVDSRLWEVLEARNEAIAKRMEDATVWVLAEEGDGNISMGSGFIVADGYIMTNSHVVEDAVSRESFYVLNHIIPMTPARLVKRANRDESFNNDFALLRYDPGDLKIPPLAFNTEIKRMARVFAWGFPGMVIKRDARYHDFFGGEGAVAPPVVYTEGAVSAIIERPNRHIAHSAAIAQGNSGGPLVNRNGEVVGINTWGATEYDSGGGANLFVSLVAADIVEFLRSAGLNPLIAGRDQMGIQREASAPAQSQSEERSEAARLLAAAEQGDALSQAAVGYNYYMGVDGFEENEPTGIMWLERAVEQGEPAAQGLLGLIHIIRNDGHTALGVELLTKGAEAAAAGNGSADLMARLGTALYFGESLGVPYQPEEALKWAEKAADAGVAHGKALLAALYYLGVGEASDAEKAFALAEEALAVEDSNSLAKAVLAHIYFDGLIIDADLDKARELAVAAAEEGEGLAQGLLAFIYLDGAGVEEDHQAAANWAELAADQADPFGQYALGRCYMEEKGVRRDPARAWSLFKLASSKVTYNLQSLMEELEEEMSPGALMRAERLVRAERVKWGLE